MKCCWRFEEIELLILYLHWDCKMVQNRHCPWNLSHNPTREHWTFSVQKWKCMFTQKNGTKIFIAYCVNNSQTLEATQMSFIKLMAKQTSIHPHKRILFCNTKEWMTCSDLDGSQGSDVKWTTLIKPISKVYPLYDSIHIIRITKV